MQTIPITRLILLAGTALLLSFAVGCGGSSSSSSSTQGTLNLSITDAPIDEAAELWLTFTHVTLQGPEGSEDPSPLEIPPENQRVNLMEYTGTSSATLIQGISVPAGTYRIRLDPDLLFTETEQRSWIGFTSTSKPCEAPLPEGVVLDAESNICRYPLTIPSAEQSGFKPKGEILVSAGGVSDFTVEFDLRKNVVDPSNPTDRSYKLKPTGLRLVDDTSAGSIAGTVVLDENCDPTAARVYLYDQTGELGEFVPDDIHDGNGTYLTSTPLDQQIVEGVTSHHYLIGFVPAGDAYAVALTCESSDDPEVDEEDFPFASQAGDVSVTPNTVTTRDLSSIP